MESSNYDSLVIYL